MIQRFLIDGMTCQNCVAKIRSGLQKALEPWSIEIELATKELKIEVSEPIEESVLRDELNKLGNYSVSNVDAASESKFNLRTYKPLLIVIGYILLFATLFSSLNSNFSWLAFMRYFMAGFFIFFSFMKMLDLSGFANTYATYDVLAKRWKSYGFIYPFIELGLGVLLFLGAWPHFLFPLIIFIMGFSAIGVIRAVMDKQEIRCACLGTTINLPMTTVTIVEDVAMVVMAIIMYISI